MNQLKNPQEPKIQRKPPVPSEFWYNFDIKMFRIQPKKKWAYNRKPPESAERLHTLRGPVSYVYLAFNLDPSQKTRTARWHHSILGPRPKTLQVIKAMQDMQALEFKLDRPDIRFK